MEIQGWGLFLSSSDCTFLEQMWQSCQVITQLDFGVNLFKPEASVTLHQQKERQERQTWNTVAGVINIARWITWVIFTLKLCVCCCLNLTVLVSGTTSGLVWIQTHLILRLGSSYVVTKAHREHDATQHFWGIILVLLHSVRHLNSSGSHNVSLLFMVHVCCGN